MCWLCSQLFQRLEYAETNGLDNLLPHLHTALAEHGRLPHPIPPCPADLQELMNQPESPLTTRIRSTLARARTAFITDDPKQRKWDALPRGGEIHIQFYHSPYTIRLAIARIGPTPTDQALTKLHTELTTLITHWPETHTTETGDRKLIPSDETGRYWLVTTLTIAYQPELI